MSKRPPFSWDALHASIRPEWIEACELAQRDAETRRAAAKYNTGAVPLAAGVVLRALTEWFAASVVVEIGTFIGMSTTCMAARRHVYTCDKSNDCLPSTAARTCYPYRGSTTMLRDLVARGVRADFFFFDGRIQMEDLELLGLLMTPAAVFAFDDFEGGEKGVVNHNRLAPWLEARQNGHGTAWELFTPDTRHGANTIAVLVPR